MMHGLSQEGDQLRRKLLELCALVEENARRAVIAMRSKDAEAASNIVQSDDEIDSLEIRIEEDCIALLTRPDVSRESVRFCVAVLKINNDLERIGDLASNISRNVEELSKHEHAVLPGELLQMAEAAIAMLGAVLDALIEVDETGAREVLAHDVEVDTLNRRVYEIVRQRIMSNPAYSDRFISILSIARYLERVADYATNIAENVIYIASGNIVRHNR